MAKNFIHEFVKLLCVEVDERFYLCYCDRPECIGRYFFDENYGLVRDDGCSCSFCDNDYILTNILTGFYVLCRWDNGYKRIDGRAWR